MNGQLNQLDPQPSKGAPQLLWAPFSMDIGRFWVTLLAVIVAFSGFSCAEDSTANDRDVTAKSDVNKLIKPAPIKPGSEWRMFRGDVSQTGISSAKISDKFALRWRFKTDEPIKATAVIRDGRAFIGSLDGKFYCIEIKTGKKIWSFDTLTGPLHPEAAPGEKKYSDPVEAAGLLFGDWVYFGSHDGNLYCLDTKTGKMIWAYTTDDQITAAPVNVKSPDGKAMWIIVGSRDNHLHCVNAKTGKGVWKYETTNYINGAPAISKGVTVFGGCDGLVHVVSVKDGKAVKEIEVAEYIAATAAMVGDLVYVGHYGNKFACVDITKKKIVWEFGEKDFPFMSAPAVTEKRLVVGGQDNRVHCIDPKTGKSLWQFRTKGDVDSSPVIAGNRVIVGSADGRVYLLNLQTGEKIWDYEIGESILSSPAVVNGLFIIGSDDGSIYCFENKQ